MTPRTSSDLDLVGNCVALILAGGNGTRLGELTRWQCKPAVPFAGHYRNIDFTLSNCVNSHIRRIAVLTQYKAQTLLTHLAAGWSFLSRELGESIEVWPAQQRLHGGWYSGTADAVHQNLDLVLGYGSRYTFVLAGDHVYKMDYRRMLESHVALGADVTVGCVPVARSQAGEFGILGVDSGHRVSSFIEKPRPDSLPADTDRFLASMGVYVFNTEYLAECLRWDAQRSDSAHDFGRDILPLAVREQRVVAHRFTAPDGRAGYWRDVGTLDAYWKAHMELLDPEPAIELNDPRWPIHTLARALPPARLLFDTARHGAVINSMLSAGVVVRGAYVTRSVLSPEVHIGEGSVLDQAVVLPGARIGSNCRLRRVIVDEGMCVADQTVVTDVEGGSRPVVLLARGFDSSGSGLRSVA